ncbi:chorismate mutase [Micromonospora sp. WMMD964]|uniref:chorismate mutase n=1 Tax=Micromonospora sp. WMMD964 TaxID=3016091 RepID=UPI00249C1D45|nr:chorismate mutase [Micromonospora sp. WMMD964]WFE98806.1 chorismate mutase [Micromonospora sp. WMMD964]
MSDQHWFAAPAGSPPAGAADGPGRIAELRGVIDHLDQRIIALLAERTRVVQELTAYKTDEATVRSPDRVRQVLDRVSDLAVGNGMPPQVAVGTYRALIDELTRMQLDMLAARRAAASAGEER